MRQFIFLFLLNFSCLILCAQQPKDFTIPTKISVDKTQLSATLNWPANTNARSYSIKRKLVADTSYKAAFLTVGNISSNASTATSFTDTGLIKGKLYEYELSGTFVNVQPLTRSAYLCAGIDIEPVHRRGSLLLLCESTIAATISDRLNTLYEDLVGDGWKVIRIDVPKSVNPMAVQPVKEKILAVYNAHTDLQQILIVGHVPVPYSGAIWPDGHNDHFGSWPADNYYGCMTGTWTDTASTTYSNSTTRAETINRPGDGKFDQSFITPVQVAVGRVDFFNMPAFIISETDLLKRYLDKDHLFKHGGITVKKRALIEDNLLSYPEKFSQSAWKSYAANVGYDNVVIGQYETDLLSPDGYLWSYGCGTGSYNGANGIAVVADFVTKSHKSIFSQLFGSYFGDWDTRNNYMKAALASNGNTLTCVWGGRPHWFFHHMSAGLPIGYSTLLTVNNTGKYANPGFGFTQAHMALMGDPSLRSNYPKPAKDFKVRGNDTGVTLNWNRPPDNITGYYVYRSNSISNDFMLLNDELVTDNHFTDFTPLEGNNVYMIRGYKTDTIVVAGTYSNNSTYVNLSEGVFDSLSFNKLTAPELLNSFSASISDCITSLQWSANAATAKKDFAVEYSNNGIDFQQVGLIPAVYPDIASTRDYNYAHQPAAGKAFYRIKTINNNSAILYSSQVLLPVSCSKSTALVFPNPVNDLLNINITSSSASNNHAVLYDASGKLIVKKNLRNGTNSIDVSTLSTGIYFLKIFMNAVEETVKIKK